MILCVYVIDTIDLNWQLDIIMFNLNMSNIRLSLMRSQTGDPLTLLDEILIHSMTIITIDRDDLYMHKNANRP